MARSMKSVCFNWLKNRNNLSAVNSCCKHNHRRYSSSLSSYIDRSHTCGELRLCDVGEQVTLYGWVQYQRYGKFLLLRDWHGSIQITINDQDDNDVDKLPFESVLEIKGKVIARPKGQENKKMPTGDIEVQVKNINILNQCKTNLPFEIRDFHKVKESLRMEYRYLDIRQKMLQQNLRLRSQMVMKIRNFLCNKHGFVDVETPTLFRKTPGGAQEFIVPTQKSGKFYTLPQSPQQFKQLLMVGGIDRYVQIARCYRDEGAKPDRQPEFTQVDIEMSFVNQDNIMKLIEDLIVDCWPLQQLTTPFPRYTYHHVMSLYGVDKPDTRFEMTIKNVTDILQDRVEIFKKLPSNNSNTIQAIKLSNTSSLLSNTELKYITEFCQEQSYKLPVLQFRYSKDGTWSSNIYKLINNDSIQQLQTSLQVETGDIILLTCGSNYQPHTVLGKIRLMIADKLESKGIPVREKDKFNFLWVYEFPLFLPKEDGSGDLESAHHPFTALDPRDKHLLSTQPLQVRSEHYDLVLNGNEIGGGSIRIHQADLQKCILHDILKEDTSQLNHLLEALDSGCPPHGGIALGLDRLMAVVCNASSIRDVIAFPKSGEGKDLMSGAPSKISQEDLDLYHITIKDS
ncbi:aspartate--tRNA ligase, mitochondrial [Patella vulgata]|uniref:aspartate--tRNA ligase, mitochondrial n=1 Tax=Patella vulgata TaxID=6465 RepID=UPI0021801D0E|nr:aspartate--tRNA ligase, mitochondrial [Patella vulgata]